MACSAEGQHFYLGLSPETDLLEFGEDLGRYIKHLLDEFGDPGRDYTFHLSQQEEIKYRLIYSEVNNSCAIAV